MRLCGEIGPTGWGGPRIDASTETICRSRGPRTGNVASEAAIPDDAAFATKATIAKKMLARGARGRGVGAVCDRADKAYGGDYKLRSWYEDQCISYVVAVPRNHTIPTAAAARRSPCCTNITDDRYSPTAATRPGFSASSGPHAQTPGRVAAVGL